MFDIIVAPSCRMSTEKVLSVKKYPSPLFLNMIQSLVNNGPDMLICQKIIDLLALPPGFDQPGLFEDPQLMGNSALGHLQELCQVTYTNLGPEQGKEDPDPGGIPKDLEQLRQITEFILAGHLPAQQLHFIPMYFRAFTALHIAYRRTFLFPFFPINI